MTRGTRLLGNVLLASSSLLAGLYILEFAVRVVTPEAPGLLSVDPFSVLEARRAEGVTAYPATSTVVGRAVGGLDGSDGGLFPLGTVSKSRIVFCGNGRTGDVVEYDSDEYGFRNPAGIWAAPPAVVLVGDSYTQGYCVGEGDDIAGQLRTRGYEALNLGRSASGPLTALAIVSEYVRPIRPSQVFWLHFEGNDLRNLFDERSSPSLNPYLRESFGQGLFGRQQEADSALIEFFEARIERVQMDRAAPSESAEVSDAPTTPSGVMPFLKLWRLRQRLGLTRSPDPTLASASELAEVIARADAIVRGGGGQLTVVYLPHRIRYESGAWADQRFDRPGVLAALDSIGVAFLDLTQDFATFDRAVLFDRGTGNHYTPEGYRLVADAIIQQLGGPRP